MELSYSRLQLITAMLAIGCLAAGAGSASAQDENLNRALKDQQRRSAGLAALAETIKGLMYEYLPEAIVGKPDSEEKAPAPEAATKVEVRDVELTEVPATATSAASDQVADQAALKAAEQAEQLRLHRELLQEAVTKLDIRGTFPKRKQILIGAQNLGVGDNIAIEFKQKLFHLEIIDVTSKDLKMKDRETQTLVNLGIGVSIALPPGMTTTRPPDAFGMAGETPAKSGAAPDPAN
jgi:hypothetical protein